MKGSSAVYGPPMSAARREGRGKGEERGVKGSGEGRM
jgi:hypothetical protein